jgi:hypothetical protein
MTVAPSRAAVGSDRTAQLRAGAIVIGVLAVVGAALGLVWQAWSPPGPFGIVLTHGIQADETEAFVGSDGRFALITVIVGLLAGGAAWLVRPMRDVRGPYLAIALAVGGAVGAALTELVGYLVRGSGTTFTCAAGRCIDHLPLTVHMHALLLAEAIAALLVYTLCVAFAVADDLGRPDLRDGDVATPPPPPPPPPPSFGPQPDPQQAWGHRDSPGPA